MPSATPFRQSPACRRFSWLALAIATITSAAAQEPMLSEITVSGDVSDIDERRSSATQKTIINRGEIEATGGLTVGEVLGKLPGVAAGMPSSDGTVALSARGMVRDSVQVLVDGERPAGNSRHSMLIISRMPAGELERVEIMRGASAEFGSSAPLTINLVTNRSTRREALTYKLAAGVRDGEPLAQMSLSKEGRAGAWSWTLPLSISEFKSPVDKTTLRQNAAGGTPTLWQNDREQGTNTLQERYFAPKLNWKEGKSSFNIWPMIYYGEGRRKTQLERTQYADPVAESGLANVLQRNDNEDSRYRINRLRLESETFAAGNKLSARLSLMDGSKHTDTTRASSGDTSQEALRRDENEINAATRLDRAWSEHLTSAGLEYVRLRRRDAQDYTGDYVDSEVFRAGERQGTLWLQDEWAVSNALTLTTGVRGESIVLDTDESTQRHGALSPSIAARWDLDDGWLLRSSLGAAIKAPKLDEISNAQIRSTNANSPLEPDRRGNPLLDPEKSVGLELNLEHYWPNETAVVGVNAYLRETQDFVERRVAQEGARWVERPYNEGDAQHWGIELDGKLKADALGFAGASLRSHLTLPYGRVDDRRLAISRAPRELPSFIWTFGYDQNLPSLASTAGVLLQRTGPIRTDIPSEQWAETGARSVLDAYWVRKLDRMTNLRFTLQNILGEDFTRTARYWSAGQQWQLGSADSQPRAFMITLEGKL
jgi:iron complex outermembrane receptor protein